MRQKQPGMFDTAQQEALPLMPRADRRKDEWPDIIPINEHGGPVEDDEEPAWIMYIPAPEALAAWLLQEYSPNEQQRLIIALQEVASGQET